MSKEEMMNDLIKTRGFEDEMTNHCIGSLPELFDGNPPFKGRGAVSFAMNVAEMLRILKLLSKYNF